MIEDNNHIGKGPPASLLFGSLVGGRWGDGVREKIDLQSGAYHHVCMNTSMDTISFCLFMNPHFVKSETRGCECLIVSQKGLVSPRSLISWILEVSFIL